MVAEIAEKVGVGQEGDMAVAAGTVMVLKVPLKVETLADAVTVGVAVAIAEEVKIAAIPMRGSRSLSRSRSWSPLDRFEGQSRPRRTSAERNAFPLPFPPTSTSSLISTPNSRNATAPTGTIKYVLFFIAYRKRISKV